MKSPERLFPAVSSQVADTFKVLKLLALVLLREYREGGIKHRAMSLVYTSLLSLAPLLAVSFSVLKAFGVHNEIQPLLLEMLAPLGDKAKEITDKVIGFVANIQVGVLGFVGFLMLFYTVVSLLEQIEDSFNHIWRVSRTRPLYRRFSDYLSIVLIGPVLLFSAIGIAASMSSMEIVQRLIALEPFGTAYYLAGVALPYVLIVAAFTFAYSFIPNTTVKWRPALTGGLFAGLSWKATGFLFAEFAVNSARYSAIYSGFAVILLSMIWLYLSWLILLLGSVVSFHVQFPRYLGYSSRRPHLSPQSQERLALLLMILIGRSHARGEPACTLPGLADQVNLPWEAVADPLECLKRRGLLLSLNGEQKAYVLARDTDAILLSEVVEAVRTAGDQPVLTLQEEPDAVREILAAIDRSPEAVLGNRSLRDVVRIEG
ncbi:YhjD/YihY/BrkB family envelope integrity protein [Methylococcus sp. ANG]|uniref:YhjD/YihY/BrkB family envelope integrity protein n=1 Tax=Methylococcus sp. ANG TaxID=3231903 RepID=UPI00345AA541